MTRCWDTDPKRRPSALTCTTETEELYDMHKVDIIDAVYRVLKKLDQKEEEIMTEQIERVPDTTVSVSECEKMKIRDTVPTGRPPIQEMDGRGQTNRRDVERARGLPSSQPSRWCYDDVSRQSTAKGVKRSSRQLSSPDTLVCQPAAAAGVQINLCHVTGVQYGNNNTMNLQVGERPPRKRHPTAPA
ncbi:hypothetical protein EYF80_036393 [Liparis tanakae]|uniref:Uncharacterized protein n=1 Tax=Liparis tanakae TaxID=230148 RepID=A0A4Z2GIY0_9TELE|nr:hypothetical protein EYF80_036393 [Liparis tanakae]